METKEQKFWSLFKQQSFVDVFNSGGYLNDLLEVLSEDEIDFLVKKNVVFIRSTSPSSTITIPKIEANGELILINFDHNCFKHLLPEEAISIILHEIGHVINPELKGMEAEYAADAFAASKGDFAKWNISALKKGSDKGWIGFEKNECEMRIKKMYENISSTNKEEEL